MSRGERWMGAGLVATALLATGGCAGSRAAAAGQGVEQLVGTPDALIQMRRGGCPPDQCPVYGVSVFMDGTVVYDGRVNVAVVGERRAVLPPDRLTELLSVIEAMGFLDTPEGCCVCPDAAAAHLTVLDYRPGSTAKTVVHDEACDSAPAAFRALEQSIEQATGVAKWTAAVRRSAGGDAGSSS